MNKLFLAFIFAFVHGCGCIGIAQTTPNTQTYFQNLPTPVNLIKNPDARLNALDVQKTGTVVVTATAATGNSPSYFSLGAISTLGYAEFDLRPVKSDMTSGQCEFKGKYFGTEASKYSARIFNGTTEIIKVVLQNTTSDLSNGGPWKEFSVGAPCSANPKVRIYADAVGLSLNVNRLYYDKATNIGNVSQAYKIGSISVTGCSWSSAVPQITAANFPVTTGCTYSTTGEVLAPSTMIPGFRLNSIKPGAYQIIGTGSFVKTVTTNGGSALFRFSDGSIYSAISQSGLSANSDLATPSINGSFEYSSPLGQTTIQVQGWANNSLIGAAINGGFRFDVYYFPSASELVVSPETPRTPNIVRYTSGSGTYMPTPGTKYITVEMVGGGGGGSGSSTSAAGNGGTGGNGTNTTFGSSLLIANGGGGAQSYTGLGVGGSFTVNSPAINIGSTPGANSNPGIYGNSTSSVFSGPSGASSFFGGAGIGGFPGSAAGNAKVNTGSGGGGAGSIISTASVTGSAGASGGYVLARINYPSGSYAYTVGAGGTAGGAGTSGLAGGNGGSGVITITEYFSNDVNAILAGTEQAHGIFYNVAGTTIGTTTTPVPFTTVAPGNQNKNVEWDASNTCARVNVAGIYSISATALMGNASYPSGEYHMQINVARPTVETIVQQFNFTSGTTGYMPVSVTANGVYLPAQSCIAVFIYQSSGANKALHVGSSRTNMLSISKTGYLQ